MHIRDQKEKGQMNGAERMSGKVVVPLGCHRGNGNRRCFGGRRRAVTALLSGKERCWSVVPVDREGSKTELRSENLSPPLDAMETIGAACEPGNVSTRAAPMESVRGPDPSGSPQGSSGSAEPQLRHRC